jgi:predicted dehydrogenase
MTEHESTVSPVTLGIIGFGWFAELLVTRVVADVPGLRVVGAVDPSEERRARAESLGIAAASSLDELVEKTGCEAVAVITPHDTHRAIVQDAAARGLHVFCEKAFAVTSEDCVAMIEACETAGVELAVGHMQKLFPTHRRAVEIARSGRYGRVASIAVDGHHWCPVLPGWWRSTASCGGLLYRTGIHDLDTMRAVAGCEARTVYAVAGPRFDPYTEHEDVVAVTITYDDGAIGTLQVAEQHPIRPFEESFDTAILFEGGGVRFSPGTATLEHAPRNGQERGETVVEKFGSFESMEEAAYRAELTRFAATVRGEQPPDGSALDGLRCIETLEAIYRSVASGRPEPVVKNRVVAEARR